MINDVKGLSGRLSVTMRISISVVRSDAESAFLRMLKMYMHFLTSTVPIQRPIWMVSEIGEQKEKRHQNLFACLSGDLASPL